MPPSNKELIEFWRAKKRGKEAVAALEKSKTPKAEKLPVEVIHKGNAQNYFMGIKQIGSHMLLVGVPGDTSTAFRRRKEIQKRIEKFTSTKKASLLKKKKLITLKKRSNLSNAYLLAMFEKGSPLKQQPPRSVLKASLFFAPNKKQISEMLAQAAKLQLDGQSSQAQAILKKVGIFASQAARNWFTNPANGWPGNSPATIRAKGFDSPGIFSDTMRKAITYVLREEKVKDE